MKRRKLKKKLLEHHARNWVNVHILLKGNIRRKWKRVLATKFRELGSVVGWGGWLHNGLYSRYMNICQLVRKQRTTSANWLKW